VTPIWKSDAAPQSVDSRQAQLKDDGNVYFSDDEPRFQELLEEPSVNQ